MTAAPHQDRASYLLSSIGVHAKLRFIEMLAPMGLQPQHFGVLRRLSTHEGSTQQEVADDLRIRRSLMVGLVDELEHGGWVERRRHPDDRRANALHLTAAGRRALTRCNREADRLDAELLDALPAGDRATFCDQLRRLGVATGVADGIYPNAEAEIIARRHADQHP